MKDWLQSTPLDETHLQLVLKTWGDEYVVHLYNEEDGGYYYGVYCQTLKEAEKAYELKLGRYQEMKRPHNLITVLEQIRATGLVNMAYREEVAQQAQGYGLDHIAEYLRQQDSESYYGILTELGSSRHTSLAQQLADAMGWEVIVE